jgi:hypothetical protein
VRRFALDEVPAGLDAGLRRARRQHQEGSLQPVPLILEPRPQRFGDQGLPEECAGTQHMDRQIAELVSTRQQMHNTLKTWDLKLEGTPADQRAHLLEGLGGTGRPKPAGRDTLHRRGSRP